MKLTKYQHACFSVEEGGQILLVDPGEWSADLIAQDNIVAIFITHEHFDHCSIERISAVSDKNPNVVIISNQNVLNMINLDISKKLVQAGDTVSVGSFSLEVFGGQHAAIYTDFTPPVNVGVMINNTVYYAGDSFVAPSKPVDVLALPVSAPWLSFKEAMDYLENVKPRRVFPTHDAILSDYGKDLLDQMVTRVAEKIGSSYQRINGSIEL